MDVGTEGQMDGQMEGHTDGQMEYPRDGQLWGGHRGKVSTSIAKSSDEYRKITQTSHRFEHEKVP